MGIEGTYLLTHEDTMNIHESELRRDYLDDTSNTPQFKYSAIDACELEALKIPRQNTYDKHPPALLIIYQHETVIATNADFVTQKFSQSGYIRHL